MSVIDLLNQWQDSIESAQPEAATGSSEELTKATGVHVASDLRVGEFLNELTNDLTWGFYCV